MRAEEGLILLSAKGTIEWANQAAADLLGYSQKELTELAVPLLSGQKSAEASGPVTSAFQEILAGRISEADGDARFAGRGGRRIAVHWKLWALPDTGSNRPILLSLSETAQASPGGLITSGYRDMVEHAVEGVFRTTLDGRLLEVNPALARICGYVSAAEMVQEVRNVSQLYVDPNRRDEFKRLLDQHGEISDFQSEAYTAEGKIVWVAEYARVVRNSEGTPLYYEGSLVDISQRKQAELALKRNEEKFRHLVERTNVVPWEADFRSGTFTYVGPQATRLMACSIDEWLQPGFWMRHIHPDDREWILISRQEAIEKGREFECEYRLIRDDGVVVWVREILSAPHTRSDSHLMGGFLVDVTYRRQTEESLEENQQFIEQIASASPTILYVYDPFMGKCLYLNGQVSKILGYSKEALRAAHPFFVETLAHREEIHSHLDHFEQLRHSAPDTIVERQFRIKAASGAWVWLHSRESVLKRDGGGLPVRVVGTLEDITLQKRAIEELQANEALFRRLAETTSVIPFDFDAISGRFLYIGPQIECLLKYSMDECCEQGAWLRIVHPEDLLEGMRFATEPFDGTRDGQCDFRVVSSDRRVIWVRQIFHRESGSDHLARVRGFLLDITESKKLEEEREQSRAELRELAARGQKAREEERVNIAREIHDELGQALTMMKLDLLWVSNRLSWEPSRHDLDAARVKLIAMEQTIASTLQTVRKVITTLRPPLLDELGLADAIEWHAKEFARHAALRCETKIEPVEGVPTDVSLALFRIFQEITTNIARHAKATRFTVELRMTNGTVVLLVLDNGRGISEKEMKRKGHFGLLGMKERAWAVGGQLWLESSPGKGTSIRVEVPIEVQLSHTPEAPILSSLR